MWVRGSWALFLERRNTSYGEMGSVVLIKPFFIWASLLFFAVGRRWAKSDSTSVCDACYEPSALFEQESQARDAIILVYYELIVQMSHPNEVYICL